MVYIDKQDDNNTSGNFFEKGIKQITDFDNISVQRSEEEINKYQSLKVNKDIYSLAFAAMIDSES